MWKAFAEQFKECGRNGTLFIVAVLMLLPMLVLTSQLAEALDRWATPVFAGFWILCLGSALASFIHAWRHPPRLGKLPPLSQNDLSAARSKLMKHRTTR
jgi:hypothetical protein